LLPAIVKNPSPTPLLPMLLFPFLFFFSSSFCLLIHCLLPAGQPASNLGLKVRRGDLLEGRAACRGVVHVGAFGVDALVACRALEAVVVDPRELVLAAAAATKRKKRGLRLWGSGAGNDEDDLMEWIP
jgi:hypothetical protein